MSLWYSKKQASKENAPKSVIICVAATLLSSHHTKRNHIIETVHCLYITNLISVKCCLNMVKTKLNF